MTVTNRKTAITWPNPGRSPRAVAEDSLMNRNGGKNISIVPDCATSLFSKSVFCVSSFMTKVQIFLTFTGVESCFFGARAEVISLRLKIGFLFMN
jgi:hypothetical protein